MIMQSEEGGGGEGREQVASEINRIERRWEEKGKKK
jgi:hypothetical protein